MLLDIPINEIVNFKSDFIDFVERKAPGIIKTISETKALSDEDEEKNHRAVQGIQDRKICISIG